MKPVILRCMYVTPLVGVWIEIHVISAFGCSRLVTPLVGVWIEIL